MNRPYIARELLKADISPNRVKILTEVKDVPVNRLRHIFGG